ncbi:hypothetical protein [Billgrantia bachuensis]|uniref:Uncharacterized protein n=1 Tax=Billgrantia bachuensis TaxID=2717286 RepID=A0ABX0PL34_9GAMM|nr:hypothetical protein [Halomonas bachuensis]NIC03980.1 hypothetical protein [Halomonas bachuensis]
MTEQTAVPEQDESVAAIEALAAEAEAAEGAAQQEAEQPEWEDVDAMEEQARAVAKMMVQATELAAGMIHPGHSLDAGHRAHGEEVMLPVARDFSGELPEWLKPYMHYLGAGMWLGGVMIGAYKARRAEEAEQARQKRAEQPTEGEGAPYGSPA